MKRFRGVIVGGACYDFSIAEFVNDRIEGGLIWLAGWVVVRASAENASSIALRGKP